MRRFVALGIAGMLSLSAVVPVLAMHSDDSQGGGVSLVAHQQNDARHGGDLDDTQTPTATLTGSATATATPNGAEPEGANDNDDHGDAVSAAAHTADAAHTPGSGDQVGDAVSKVAKHNHGHGDADDLTPTPTSTPDAKVSTGKQDNDSGHGTGHGKGTGKGRGQD